MSAPGGARITRTPGSQSDNQIACQGATRSGVAAAQTVGGEGERGIVEALRVSPSAVEKYVTNIFSKLGLPPTDTDHRRVLAVLKYLGT